MESLVHPAIEAEIDKAGRERQEALDAQLAAERESADLRRIMHRIASENKRLKDYIIKRLVFDEDDDS